MNNAPLWLSGAGVLALGIQLFVILHDVLRFAVAFDQQLVGREDFGYTSAHSAASGRFVRCSSEATAAVSIGTTPACTTRAGDLLRHFAVGAGSVNHGKHFITVGDSGDSREGHADAGDGPGDNQRFTTGRFHRGDEFRVIRALISPLRAMYFACGAFS